MLLSAMVVYSWKKKKRIIDAMYVYTFNYFVKNI